MYYNLGVFGGLGQTVTRATNDNLFGARVTVNPLGDVAYSESDLEGSKKPLASIGANYFRNTLKRQTASGTTSFEGAASNYAGSNGWLGSTAGRNFQPFRIRSKSPLASRSKWAGIQRNCSGCAARTAMRSRSAASVGS